MNYWTARSFPPGEIAHVYEPGDFILTHTSGAAGRVIRWGQRLRFRGDDRGYSYWNHAALVVSERGDLVEALVRTGATRSHISKYYYEEYTLVRVHASPEDALQIVHFADRIVGEKYGWLCDICVFVGFLTGNRLNFGVQGSIMCSGLVARAQERMGAYFDRNAESIAPADLAKYYDVRPEAHAVLPVPMQEEAHDGAGVHDHITAAGVGEVPGVQDGRRAGVDGAGDQHKGRKRKRWSRDDLPEERV